jgi:glycosyltransferase involved in cell wall biosynthesis
MLFAPPTCWGKLRVVHCGVDPSLYELKRHEGRGEQLLFVGRLTAAKGLPVLLQAVAKLEGASLNIVGEGPDRQLLEEQSRELKISDRVRFLGRKTQEQIRQLLHRADVFAMCSFAEGVPVVLMEAMAAGVPVVATQIAGIPELVENQHTGLLIIPGDVTALRDAIGRLIEDAELRNRFAAAGRAKVIREFNIHTETRWLAAILSGALAGKSERSSRPRDAVCSKAVDDTQVGQSGPPGLRPG